MSVALVLALAVGIGFACGLRTLAAPLLLALVFGSLAWRILMVAGAVIELVGDLLPFAASRLTPAPLTFRSIAGGASSAFFCVYAAHADTNIAVAGTALGIVAALAGSYAGAAYRGAVARAKLPDWPFALIEDVAAFGLAFLLVAGGREALAG